MRTPKKAAKVKQPAGGCRSQEVYNGAWAVSRAEFSRKKAYQKEQEMLATTSLKDLIK
jgi:hypothetical protein